MQKRGVSITFIVYFGVFLQVHRCRGTGTEPRLHGEKRKTNITSDDYLK